MTKKFSLIVVKMNDDGCDDREVFHYGPYNSIEEGKAARTQFFKMTAKAWDCEVEEVKEEWHGMIVPQLETVGSDPTEEVHTSTGNYNED